MARQFYVHIDTSALEDIAKAFGATPMQFEQAFKRAAQRTAGTFRRLVAREKLGLDDLRRTTAVRRRIKALFRKGDHTRDGIWFGLNDLWASEFKQRPTQTADGVLFRGKFYPKAFRIKAKGQRGYRIYRRVNGKIQEITIPIEAQGLDYLEREVLPELADAFQHHFMQDLKRRDIRARS